MPTLIKRATNTNQFISEAAEQTLISCCINCSEQKVFAALQNQNLKSNAFKEKACQCYNILIEKLGSKLKNFKDVERLVQAVTHFLDESAAEVRNKAKFGILTINNVCSSQRELEGLMLKCRLNDKQKDKIRKIIASEDFESLSNYN